MRPAGRDRPAIFAAIAFLMLAVPVVALAASVGSGQLIGFHAAISPVRLPRNRPAPIGLQLGFELPCHDHSGCPRMSGFRVDLNSRLTLDAEGLARCPLGKLHGASQERVRELCAAAEVGHGNLTTAVPSSEVAGQWETVHELLTAFNGEAGGRPAILVYGASSQLPSSHLVTVFTVRRTTGVYGSALTARVLPIAGGRGYFSALYLTLKRQFWAKGERRSFLAGTCPLPKGVDVGDFKLLRLTEEFDDGSKAVTQVEGACRASG